MVSQSAESTYTNQVPFKEIKGNCWSCTTAANKGISRKSPDGVTANPDYKVIPRQYTPTRATACPNKATETHHGACPECGKNIATIVSLKQLQGEQKTEVVNSDNNNEQLVVSDAIIEK